MPACESELGKNIQQGEENGGEIFFLVTQPGIHKGIIIIKGGQKNAPRMGGGET